MKIYDFTNGDKMNLPIPTHLKQYLIRIGNENSEYEVTGKIKCLCGNEKFEILESNNCHIIKLHCCQCGKELLLFDAGKHGWNGFVCNEEDYIDRTLPFQQYHCSKCGESVCRVTVCISSQGKEDFIEECVSFDDSFSPSDWIDGFECIAISVLCQECGFKEDNWAVLETM